MHITKKSKKSRRSKKHQSKLKEKRRTFRVFLTLFGIVTIFFAYIFGEIGLSIYETAIAQASEPQDSLADIIANIILSIFLLQISIIFIAAWFALIFIA